MFVYYFFVHVYNLQIMCAF